MTTNCVFPPELEDQQLLAHLDDPEASPEITRHLERCPHCSDKAQSVNRLQKRLTARLYRVSCPSSMELGEYHLRMLPAPQMLVVAQHVRGCPHCTREVAELEDFLGVLAPEDSLHGKAQVLVARLVGGQGESGSAAITPALRGEAKGPITFEADGVVIVLDIQPANEVLINMLGQVAADDQEQWTGALVELREDGELQFLGTVDDLGAFRVESISPGSKELKIMAKSGTVVVVSNLELAT